ncbi:PBP1A family penicillin-binding protein [Cytobacillus sp. Hz8]|uniref:PBP1A family penicillin-binding protein n=1 Tax=Cytobacillus sp. Hz8 TaxID=3347168 RepID=UPI0035E141A0
MAEKYQTREERRKQLTSQPNKKKRKAKSSIWKKIFLTLITLGIIGFIGGVATFAFLVKDAPKLNEKLLKDPISSKIYDKNGKPVTEIGTVKRDYVDYEDIPKDVEDAILATEDVRFYKHHGIDLIRLGGAVVANVTRGFGSEGASTLTQQVVKRSFLTPEKTIKRKAQEAWLAIQLERKYTKHEIFEMYVNKAWYNSGGHGILTASNIFFGKSLDKLTLPQRALLAGIPQSPANYDPFTHPDLAEKRRNIVLSLMYQHGFISKEEMDDAKKVPVESTLVKEDKRKTSSDIPYDSFISQVIKEIEKKYKEFDVFSDGLKIYTTLDTDAQKYVEKMLNSNNVVQFPDNKMQAGITLLDTKTGEIRAIGGGRNQKVDFGFNFATDSKRQPGSTIKPILDYGPAIDYLKWGTYHALDDKPYTYSSGQPINDWDNQHMGVMSMRTALALSRNIPALQALQAVGLDQAQEFSAGLGIPFKDIQEAYAIGGIGGEDVGVSTLQMAGAYSAFGNNGFYTEPHAVTKIELRDGTKLDMKPEPKVAMKDYTAFMITDMLKTAVTSGTGTMANVPGLHIAGKTGTTNFPAEVSAKYNIPSTAVPDSWFAGYNTNYTAAIWTGYENQTKNYLIGSEQKIAQLLFKNLMTHISTGIDTPDFTMPNSVEKVKIEKGTIPAKLASEYTPDNQVIYEYAVKGQAPTETSVKYDKLAAPTGLKATYDEATNSVTVTWNYQKEDGTNVKFDVSASQDGGGEQNLTTTTQNGFIMKNATPGSTYTFKVVAVSDNQQSDAVTTSIKIPSPLDIGNTPGTDDQNNQPGNQNGQNNNENNGNTGNNGNENGNGNNPGNDNGNGTNDGNSSDDGNNNNDDSGDTNTSPSTGT